MRELYEAITGIAVADLHVLLIGEQGTGKGVIARLIHAHQGGKSDTFLTVVCSEANPPSLTHVFLQTAQARTDIPEQIHTVFLDNLADLAPPSQSALAEVLTNSHRTSQNSTSPVRIISATRRSLDEDIRAKRFREDLFYRLNGISLHVPPLRHRKEDIPYLVDFFLTLHRNTLGGPPTELQETTMQTLLLHPWPGNVSELEEFAKTVLISGELSALARLKAHLSGPSDGDRFSTFLPLKEATKKASRQVERELILNTLARTRWNRKRAARVLGISYKALLYKLKHIALDDSL